MFFFDKTSHLGVESVRKHASEACGFVRPWGGRLQIARPVESKRGHVDVPAGRCKPLLVSRPDLSCCFWYFIVQIFWW